MAASKDTIREVLRVIETHVDKDTLRAILVDLLKVPGNSSFETTIRRMANELGIAT